MSFFIGLGIGIFLLVACIGYLYSNGSTLIWKKEK
jgi:hypothetical protein